MSEDAEPSLDGEPIPTDEARREDDEATHHAFWADAVADRVLDRDPSEPIVVKGGISPSGVPHLGNVNEIMRGYFVAEALRDRGYDVRQVFTTDDRDPLRKLPRTLADLDGNLVDFGDVDAAALGKNMGHSYTDVPDPFGCCESYGAHFSTLIAESAELLDVPLEVVSTTELYESGRMDDVVEHVLANQDRARRVLAEYQDKIDEDYVPFNPICANCGKITETVTSVDVADGEGETTIEYRCTDMEAGNRTIDGCGHEGTAGVREGKLPWRFEWPAQWQVLGVDFEPFGKDHAEGSWPSGKDIAENVLDIDSPEPMVYEWFTLDDEPFSSSAGNVILVHDVLRMVEPEVLRYFFTKEPRRARDFSVERLDLLVDEFDRFERLYFGETSGEDDETAFAGAAYPATIRPTVAATFADRLAGNAESLRDGGVADQDAPWLSIARDPAGREAVEDLIETFAGRIRLPYTYAAVLGMYESESARIADAEKQDHVPAEAAEWARECAFGRVALASEWATRTENEYDYTVQRASMPEADFDRATAAALAELATFVEAGHDGEEIQGEIFEIARRHDVDVGDFFSAGYRLLFDEDQGPQLGPFIAKLDRDFVVRRLRQEA